MGIFITQSHDTSPGLHGDGMKDEEITALHINSRNKPELIDDSWINKEDSSFRGVVLVPVCLIIFLIFSVFGE